MTLVVKLTDKIGVTLVNEQSGKQRWNIQLNWYLLYSKQMYHILQPVHVLQVLRNNLHNFYEISLEDHQANLYMINDLCNVL